MKLEIGEYRLRKLADNPFTTGRDGQRLRFYNGKIHATGGWKDLGGNFVTYSEHYTIDPVTAIVTRLPDAPWRSRHCHGMEVLGDKLYVFMGDRTFFPVFTNDLWSYDPVNKWQKVLDDCGLGNRVGYANTTDGEYIYLMGGVHSETGYLVNNTAACNIWRWKPGMSQFQKITDFTLPQMNGSVINGVPTGLEHGAMYFFKGGIYFRGGGKHWQPGTSAGQHTLPYYVNPYVFKSPDKGLTWQVVAEPGRNSYWCAGSANEDVMFHIHGSTGEANGMRHGVEISENGVDWLELPIAPGTRHAMGDCTLWQHGVFGCGTGQQGAYNDLWLIKKIA